MSRNSTAALIATPPGRRPGTRRAAFERCRRGPRRCVAGRQYQGAKHDQSVSTPASRSTVSKRESMSAIALRTWPSPPRRPRA